MKFINWNLYFQIFIQGSQNLNRAVDKDVVGIEMLPEEQWTCPSSMVMVDEDEKVRLILELLYIL